MSQRIALLAACVIAVLVGVVIVTNRDQLLVGGPAASMSDANITSTGGLAPDDVRSSDRIATRVVEVTLPALGDTIDATDDDQNHDARSGDDRDDDHDWDDDHGDDDDDHDDDRDDDDD